ncbi:MAG: hypothetical protein COT74_05780 [Bdellovibrionales bacterium CG10_big_fil_rev_8_21_14_0_10_45_34]|nr:MAG: hypothetical protein COT74_05780 [Bdellovibrionales bacterium CG10_big_fil_rev_8_21_14_0_10_45_34]
MPPNTSYLIVGDGRLGRHLFHWLQLKKQPAWKVSFRSWREISESQRNSTSISPTHVLLATRDADLQEAAELISLRAPQASVCHFSAVVNIEPVPSYHPLMTFSSEKLYDEQFYDHIRFVSPNSLSSFCDHLPAFRENAFSEIPEAQRALYHSLCVLGSSGISLMLLAMDSLWQQRLPIPVKDFRSLALQSLKNYMESGEGAITGPIVRSDEETLQRNIQSLRDNQLQELYKLTIKIFKEVVREPRRNSVP